MRLKPYTSVLPKPLMPLGDRAILEIVISQLARQGFVDITLSVGHLGHLIEAVFGGGADHGVEVAYVREDVPLGTAGSLRLVPSLDDTFLMLNGDLVTTLDYRELVRSHRESGNLLTIATRERRVEVDYGVLTTEPEAGKLPRIVHYTEKPNLDFLVSMGIYVMEPEALSFIPENGYFDFPDLVQRLIAADAPIGSFQHDRTLARHRPARGLRPGLHASGRGKPRGPRRGLRRGRRRGARGLSPRLSGPRPGRTYTL